MKTAAILMLLAAAGVPASMAAATSPSQSAPAPTTTPLPGVMPLTDAAPTNAKKDRRVRSSLSLNQMRNRLAATPPRTNKGWQLAKVESPKVVQGPKTPPPQKLKKPVTHRRAPAADDDEVRAVNATPVVAAMVRGRRGRYGSY
ncbi:MAG TPA: hypothetical protein VJ859_02210 [Allosphingosinicella sp.]|nr:hypothetical protein [Allosphingosinicella sp.]